MKLARLAEFLNAQLSGHGEIDITGAAAIHEAREGQVSFISGQQHMKDLEQTRAAAVIAPLEAPEAPVPLLKVKNPILAFARVLELFYVKPRTADGISDKSSIGKDVVIGNECSIHAFAVIGDRARIGNRVTIHSGSHIGEDSAIDDDTVIHPNVSIGHRISVGKRVVIHSGTVIGSDGFRFVTEGGRHHKIPQVGGVIIEDDVEIGANCAIDRAMMSNTLIRRGTKIDNLVQVAHNVTIGEHCLIAGQAGIAGSSKLGNYVVLGGQAGVADHINVGDQVMAGGGSAITRDVAAGQVIVGYNAMPIRDWLKVQALLPRLPDLKKTVTALEKQVRELKEKEN